MRTISTHLYQFSSIVISRLVFLGAVLMLISAVICVPAQVRAFSFVGVPTFDQNGNTNNDWGRILWNIQPDNNHNLNLLYNFGPAGLQLPIFQQGQVIGFVPSLQINAQQQQAITAALATWQQASLNLPQQFQPNVLPAPQLNNTFDFQTAALHEIGHTLGLGHPNVGVQQQNLIDTYFARNSMGVAGIQLANAQDFPGSANNVVQQGAQLFNFALAQIQLQGINSIAQTTVVQWPQLAPQGLTRNVPQGGATEAAMVQLAFQNETQRALAADDVAGLRALEAGPDFITGNNDDFVFNFNLANLGQLPQILFFDAALPAGVGITNSVATRGMFRQPSMIYLDEAYDGTLLAIAEMYQDSSGNIQYFDVVVNSNAPFNIPEPSTFLLLCSGLSGMMLYRRKFRK